jgi:hydrogenase nickel incorporation protein HypB
MCATCGCGESSEVTIRKPSKINVENLHVDQHDHDHHHDHDHNHHDHNHDHHQHDHHSHEHGHHHAHEKTVLEVEQDILGANKLLAERNRGYFEAKNIFTINLVSSPGSGKTSLLEKTLADLSKEIKFTVIEGDQQTFNDANRIQALEIPVIQINTGQGCHLDSDMVNRAVKQLQPPADSILFIENVGNLVCPSLFDLGENKRVVIISTTEGDDKPIKYPDMFLSSDICIINKIDLLPYVKFSVDKVREYALRVNHHLQFFVVSATTGEGMEDWYDWLGAQIRK